MKGVILAGGLGTRLNPLTISSNKHLLPIYDKPMIYYPINTLIKAGIKDIMLIVSGPHAGSFLPVLKNGEEFGCNLVYAYQEKPDGGIADALKLAEEFACGDNICVILGDNTTDANISSSIEKFDKETDFSNCEPEPRAHIFLKQVNDARSFGVVKFKDNKKEIEEIIEKPENPPTNMAVTGVYIYDCWVFNFIRKCKPSARGQLEITDVNNLYIKKGKIEWSILYGFWQDAGTFENLYLANKFWAEKDGKS